jgi:hypothetical protein
MAPISQQKDEGDRATRLSFGGPERGGDNAGASLLAALLSQSVDISRRIRSSYTELYVYCFYVDFNGIEYGTVREVFVFKPYEREVEIRNLQAYPVGYLAEDGFLGRGKRFLDVTEISHLQYDGLTVGPAREEVRLPETLRYLRRMSHSVH